jgi:hypothetical protein
MDENLRTLIKECFEEAYASAGMPKKENEF